MLKHRATRHFCAPRRERQAKRVLAFGGLLLALLARAVPARADDAWPIQLDWVRAEGAESCASSSELEAKLQKALAEANVKLVPRSIEGLITHDATLKQYRVRLRVLAANQDNVGVRELAGGDQNCQQLTPSIVLVLAILVELGAGAKQKPLVPRAAHDAERAPFLTGERPETSTPRQHANSKARTRFPVEPSAALAVALGLAPKATLGPMLGLRVRTPWLIAFRVRVSYWPAGDTRIVSENAQSASVNFNVFESDLALCLPLPPLARNAPWWVAGCWGAALVVRAANAKGLSPALDSLHVMGTAQAALEAGYEITSRILLSLEATLLAFGRNDVYTFEDVRGKAQLVFKQNPFAGTFAMGIGVRL
jgi:hypothetical protein